MYFVYLITLLIISCHFFNWLKGKTVLFSKNKLTIPLLIFFSTQIISTFFSVDLHTSIFGYYSRLNGGLLSLFCYITLFLILSVYINSKLKQKIIFFSLISASFVSIYAILEHFGIDKNTWVQDVQSRVFSTLGQPNWLAAYLCVLLPFAVNQLINSKKYSLIIINSSLVIILYLALLFTKSKSGIVAAIISLGIYFIFYIRNKILEKKDKSPFSMGIQGVLLLISVFLVLTLSISNPIKDLIFPSKISNSSLVISNSSLNITPSGDIRKIVWAGSFELWKRFPLFGTGPETFAYTYYWTRPASHNLTSEWDFLYNKAHNEYLNYLATTGTFGFITYIFFITTVIIILCKKILFPLSLKEGQGVDFDIVILASFISILITNFAGFSVVITSLYLFLLPALISPELPKVVDLKPKNKLLIFPLIIIFLYFLYKILSFFIADIAYSYSQSYYSRQLYSTAESYINISLSLNSSEAVYYSQAALIAAKSGEINKAVNYSNQAMTLSPASTNLWKERAQIFSTISVQNPQYFVYALDALEKCARLAPTDAKVFYLLGKFYDAASETDSAIKNYQKALSLKSNYDYAAFALGEIYYQQKNYSEAKKYFETTLQIAPTNLDAQNYLSLIATAAAKNK